MQRKITPSEEFEKEFFQRGAEGQALRRGFRLFRVDVRVDNGRPPG